MIDPENCNFKMVAVAEDQINKKKIRPRLHIQKGKGKETPGDTAERLE